MARRTTTSATKHAETVRSVYGYARVSTVRQSEEGQSLNAQEERIAGYCAMNGLTLASTFVEHGVSGSMPLASREAGGRLVSSLRSGDIVITTRLDRLFRDAVDGLMTVREWRERGVTLHVIELGGSTDGMVGMFMLHILSAVADMERLKIRERIRDVKEYQKAQGRYLGGRPPAGMRIEDGKLVGHDARQALIAGIMELHGRRLSVRKIAAAIGSDLGESISPATVARIIQEAKMGRA